MEASIALEPAPLGRGGSTDVDLVAAARAGDKHAFGELYARYRQPVQTFVRRMVGEQARAEDVTHDVFVSALRRLRANDQPINFRPWIYEIARNACIDQHRRGARARMVPLDTDDALAPSDARRLVCLAPGPEEVAERRQRLAHLCGAFGGLSESEHQVLVLRELEGLSYREIGERLDLTRPAVESTLFRARRRLADEYQDLSSGHRCVRVQASITAAATGTIGKRERRRCEGHVARCRPCRAHAHRLGVEVAPPTVVGRLAAVLPLPVALRPLRHAVAGGSATAVPTLPIAAGAGTMGAAIAKVAVVAASLAVVGIGGEVALHRGALPGWLPGGETKLQSVREATGAAGGSGPGSSAAAVFGAPVGAGPHTGPRPAGALDSSRRSGGTAGAPATGAQDAAAAESTAAESTASAPAGDGVGSAPAGHTTAPEVPAVAPPSLPEANAPTAPTDPVKQAPKPNVSLPSPSRDAPALPSAPAVVTPDVPARLPTTAGEGATGVAGATVPGTLPA